MPEFLLGAQSIAASVAGLFFLRFWRKAEDRLFLFFAAAFFLLAVNWLLLALVNRDEPHTALYTVRLAAFAIIMLGIGDKNWRGRGAGAGGSPAAEHTSASDAQAGAIRGDSPNGGERGV